MGVSSAQHRIIKRFSESYSSLKRSMDFPRNIFIELTNRCNLSCSMCPKRTMKRPPGDIQKKTFLKIADELSGYSERSVWLHLFGEPLLSLDLIWAIRSLKERCRGVEVNLSTNCLLLDTGISDRLLDSGLDRIRLCVDTADPASYHAMRTGGDLDRVTKNVKNFLSMKYARSAVTPRAEIQYMAVRGDGEGRRRFFGSWRPLLSGGDAIHVQRFTTFANAVSDTEGRFEERALHTYLRRTMPCRRIWRDMGIYCTGDVSACCYDIDGELAIGNVNEGSLREIWHGKRLKDLREAHLRRDLSDIPLCARCTCKKLRDHV